MGLAGLCRAFCLAMRPRLLSEVEITQPHQLEHVVKFEDDRVSLVKLLRVDLLVRDLAWNEGMRWYGGDFGPMLERLSGIEKLDVRFRWAAYPRLEDCNRRHLNLGTDLQRATGMDVSLFNYLPSLPNLVEAHFQLDDNETPPYQLIFKPPPPLRSLFIMNSRLPPARPSSTPLPAAALPHEVLAIPLLPIPIPDALQIFGAGIAHLRHLEITLTSSGTLTEQTANLNTLFTHLAPTLTRLSLRIRRLRTAENRLTSEQVSAAVLHCTKLDHLEIGGRGLHEQTPKCLHTSLVSDLTFLPQFSWIDPRFKISILTDFARELAREDSFVRLRRATVFVGEVGAEQAEDLAELRSLGKVCKERDVVLVVRKLPLGWEE